MSFMPPLHSPKAAFKDLMAFLRQRSPEKTIGLFLAILTTIVIVILFFVDSKYNTAPPPTITYVESWPENRTDDEIIAQQEIDQAEKDRALEERRRQFQELEDFNNSIGL